MAIGLGLRFLRAIPRPGKFLYFFDLKTGAEVTLNATILNKLFGVYGVLAVITGASLSPAQISMFFTSLLFFSVYAHQHSRITSQDPLACLSFAYLYLLDSLANAIYTLIFGVNWFLGVEGQMHLAAHKTGKMSTDGTPITAATTTSDGGIVGSATATPGVIGARGNGSTTIPVDDSPVTTPLILQPEAFPSILTISLLWTIRLYTILVVFAYARRVVRGMATPGEAPFEGRNGGDGWKGKLGRALLGVNKGYWVGSGGWHIYSENKFRRSEDPGTRRGRARKASTAGRNTEVERGLLANLGA